MSLVRRGEIPKDQHIHALHLEVPYAMKEADTKTLLKLYEINTKKVYPHWVRTWYLLPTQYILNPHTTVNIDYLRLRQQVFTKCVPFFGSVVYFQPIFQRGAREKHFDRS